jgi:hypothetical protein
VVKKKHYLGHESPNECRSANENRNGNQIKQKSIRNDPKCTGKIIIINKMEEKYQQYIRYSTNLCFSHQKMLKLLPTISDTMELDI